MNGDWFDEWSVKPWGIGGDEMTLCCPRGNYERPNKTPACFIALNTPRTIQSLHALARKHRRDFH